MMDKQEKGERDKAEAVEKGEAKDDEDPDDIDEDEKEEVKEDANEEEEKAKHWLKQETEKPSDIKSLKERLEVTKANIKGLGKNLVDIAKKRKKSQAKIASGRLKEREVPEKIKKDTKEMKKANLEMKAEKLSSGKSLQSEDVHQEATEKAERKWAIPRRKKRRKMHTVCFRLSWGHHSTPGPSGLEAPRTQTSAGQEVPCPSSHPQDLQFKHGEGGPLPQVTGRHITWLIANTRPPVHVPGSRPTRKAVQSGNPEGQVHKSPTARRPKDDPTPVSLPNPGTTIDLSLDPTSSPAQVLKRGESRG